MTMRISMVTAFSLLSSLSFAAESIPSATIQALTFVKEQIEENHPGAVDVNNPSFREYLNKDFDDAKNTNIEQALHAYIKGFEDPMIRLASEESNLCIISFDNSFAAIENFENYTLISIPTFRPSKQARRELEEVIATIPELVKSQKPLVINVCENKGGSTHWGDSIFKALWGEQALADAATHMPSKPFWRVSTDNHAHLSALAEMCDAPEYKEHFSNAAQEMNKKLEEGETHTLMEFAERPVEEAKKLNAYSELGKRIFVYTDGTPGKAVHYFVEYMLKMPNVTLIGQPIKADSTYGETRSVAIPNSNFALMFPIKSLHGENVAHIPKPEHLWKDGSNLRDWLSSIIRSKML